MTVIHDPENEAANPIAGGLWLSQNAPIGSRADFVAFAPLIGAGVCYARNPRCRAARVFSMRRTAIIRWRGSSLSSALRIAC